ncbi:hypothetical protein PENTCL1PPCAC_14428, partial [Pristionchus entomophagus]
NTRGPLTGLYVFRDILQISHSLFGKNVFILPTQTHGSAVPYLLCPHSIFGAACEMHFALQGGVSGKGVFNRVF